MVNHSLVGHFQKECGPLPHPTPRYLGGAQCAPPPRSLIHQNRLGQIGLRCCLLSTYLLESGSMFFGGGPFHLSSVLFSLSLFISIFKLLLVVDLLVGERSHVFWRRGHFLGATGDHSLPEKKMEGKGGGCLRVGGKKTEKL